MSFPAKSLPELLSFLDGQAEPRIVIDADFRIVAANRAYSREFAQGRPLAGRHCYEVSHHFTVPCDQAGESCPLRMSQESAQAHRVLHLHHTPRGEEHVDVETTPIRNQQGDIAYFVETLRVVKHASSLPAAAGLVGRSPSFNRMLALVMRVAPTDAAVLLLGETGTGKELVAQLLHEAGKRAAGPFVAVDCSGLTESLFESELFGYEKGAFTGANHRKIGLVESASGGTLFLDEVGDIPLPLQVKLLRLLETGTYRRVGGVETLRSDFRLVCATHRELQAMVERESFRRDLYHRISTFPIAVPSLAERVEDIPLLADSFVKRVAGERGLRLSAAARAALRQRRYSGNIRELRNLIERASILADGDEIAPAHFDMDAAIDLPTPPASAGSAFVVEEPLALDELEKRYLGWVLQKFGGDRKSLAARLKVGTRTLYRKLQSAGRPAPR
ncbi:MAG: sigma-54-dependent Fis family transcriptional regulator [Rhodocyclaceae bacterium]|nr:sigma-54-dependent Fis family transcriptional regulator [Rhodocyclaceae bacterium]